MQFTYSEYLLQFIWQHKLFDVQKVTHTVQGDALQIISVGVLSRTQGPDFTEGKIKIAETTWVGDVEIHIKASDWHKHKHSDDAHYKKVIAHVVYEADELINDAQGNSIPCIELRHAINPQLLAHYQSLMEAPTSIACASLLHDLPLITVDHQLEKSLTERLSSKAKVVQELLHSTNNDWREVLYIMIARAFGGNINADAMQALAVRVPMRLLAKHIDQQTTLEAILFGVSGLLPQQSSTDAYVGKLQTEYYFYKQKFGLVAMDNTRWKFLGLRPPNFATVRIAQLAAFIYSSHNLWSKLLELQNVQHVKSLMSCTMSSYWTQHYSFTDAAQAKPRKAQLSDAQIQQLIINAVAPSLYLYGVHMGSEAHCDYAIELLRTLPMEKNNITDLMKTLIPTQPYDAATGQAYLHQYTKYCKAKACLSCSIGYKILKA